MQNAIIFSKENFEIQFGNDFFKKTTNISSMISKLKIRRVKWLRKLSVFTNNQH